LRRVLIDREDLDRFIETRKGPSRSNVPALCPDGAAERRRPESAESGALIDYDPLERTF
jgi:hypothetical protein